MPQKQVTEDLDIRTATLADLETITQHNIAMAAETEDYDLDPEIVRRGVRRVLIDESRGVYYLAVREGHIVGQLLITREWSDWRDDWFWWIQSVYVTPDTRHTGVYSKLHHFVEEKARERPGVCGLRLYVDKHNDSAQQVYRQLGMREANYIFMETHWKGPASAKTDKPA